ncbi:MAG: cytidine deaminase [Myxococcales bacterium]|nr:cytidine deaminase [Myxococcales bacterium]MCB9545758.1 cytidine deaminase [Myxococcales bacterium]
MSDDPARLIEAALAVRLNAYAPYSHFLVGAAIEAEDGQIYAGCNVENVTFGLTRCAEQVAVARAVSEGARRFRRIAIATDADPPAVPCGMCRQVLVEFCEDLEILLVNTQGAIRRERLQALLPGAFRPADLLEREPRP